jgi:hypothetical protein
MMAIGNPHSANNLAFTADSRLPFAVFPVRLRSLKTALLYDIQQNE